MVLVESSNLQAQNQGRNVGGGDYAPIMNDYKLKFGLRRYLQTVLGGIRLSASFSIPAGIIIVQIIIWLLPAIVGVLLSLLSTGNESWMPFVSGGVFVAMVLFFTIISSILRNRESAGALSVNSEHAKTSIEDEEYEFGDGFFSNETFRFLVPKRPLWLIIVSAIVSFCVGAGSVHFLQLSVLEQFFPGGSFVLFIMGWISVCICHYALVAQRPTDPSQFRLSDVMLSQAGTVPNIYLSICFGLFYFYPVVSGVPFTTTPGVIVGQSLVMVVVLTPWLRSLAILPQLDSLFGWALNEVHVHLNGGSHAGNSKRLMYMLLLSWGVIGIVYFVPSSFRISVSAVLSIILAHFPLYSFKELREIFRCGTVKTAAVVPSHEPFSNQTSTNTHTNTPDDNFNPHKSNTNITSVSVREHERAPDGMCGKKTEANPLPFSLFIAGGIVWGGIVFSLSLVTAGESLKLVLAIIITVLWCIGWLTSQIQAPYFLNCIRNYMIRTPCVPSAPKSKTSKVDENVGLCYYASVTGIVRVLCVRGGLVLGSWYLMVYGEWSSFGANTISVLWLCILCTRSFRRLWQSPGMGIFELVVTIWVNTIMTSISTNPVSTWWSSHPLGLHYLLCSLLIDRFIRFFNGLEFAFVLLVTAYTEKKAKFKHSGVFVLVVGILSPVTIFFPVAVAALLGGGTPITPFLGLPFFIVGFPRPLQSWPNITNPFNSNEDAAFYRHLSNVLPRKLALLISAGSLGVVASGDHFLMRHDKQLLLMQVLERGSSHVSVLLKGLELQETSCHHLEGLALDELFSQAGMDDTESYQGHICNPKPYHTLCPLTTINVTGYSTSTISLTGIIDHPDNVSQIKPLLVKALCWCLVQRYGVNGRGGNADVEYSNLLKNLPKRWLKGPVHTEHVARYKYLWSSDWVRYLLGNRSVTHDSSVSMKPPSQSVKPNMLAGMSIGGDFNLGPPGLDNLGIDNLGPPGLDTTLQNTDFDFGLRAAPTIATDIDALQMLVLTCLAIIDGMVEGNNYNSAQILTLFNGRLPPTHESEWIEKDNELHDIVLRSFQYAFKSMFDSMAIMCVALEEYREIEEYFEEYSREWYLYRKPISGSDNSWEEAVDGGIPHLFKLAKNEEGQYVARVLNLQPCDLLVGKLNPEAVRGIWSSLALELLYFTNDDDERYSIQAHPILLRNLTVQAAQPPLGYPCFQSGVLTIPLSFC